MKTLREVVQDSIGNFLYSEEFKRHDQVPEAILNTIDEIAEYYEEGQLLYPEILVSRKLDGILKAIPNERIKIGEVPISTSGFKLAIKQCAPLCKESWVIYINLDDHNMDYGLISAELSSISLTLLEQLKQNSELREEDTCLAYIRRNSSSSVELQGYRNSVVVEFSLKESIISSNTHTNKLCSSITKDIEQGSSVNITYQVNKILTDAIKNGHGNLIGVIDKDPAALDAIKSRLSGGVYLESPIDLLELTSILHDQKTDKADFRYRLYSGLVKSMVNNDGITIFNTKAQLIGYHLIISPSPDATRSSTSDGTGTRSRAFEEMNASGLFFSGFFKSQDGREGSF